MLLFVFFSGGDVKDGECIEIQSFGASNGDNLIPLSTVSSQLEMGKDYSNEPLPSPVEAAQAKKACKTKVFSVLFHACKKKKICETLILLV